MSVKDEEKMKQFEETWVCEECERHVVKKEMEITLPKITEEVLDTNSMLKILLSKMEETRRGQEEMNHTMRQLDEISQESKREIGERMNEVINAQVIFQREVKENLEEVQIKISRVESMCQANTRQLQSQVSELRSEIDKTRQCARSDVQCQVSEVMEEMDTLKSDLNKNQSKCEKLEVDVDTVMVECEKKIKELEVRTIAREIEAKDNEEIRSRWMRDVYAEITDLRIEMKTNCKEVADLKIKSNAQSERRIENINVEDERNTRRNSRSSISLLSKGRNKKLKIDDESCRESDEDYTSDDVMRHTHRCKERSHRNTVKDNIEDESTSEGSSSHSCKHCSRRSEASSGERRNKRSCKSNRKFVRNPVKKGMIKKNGQGIRMRLSEIKSFTQYPSTGEEMSAKTE